MNLSTFLSHFDTVNRERDGWVVKCPAHSDGSPSLRVAVTADNTLMLHCRAGCAKPSVLKAVMAKTGMDTADMFDVVVDAVDAVKVGAQATGPTPVMVALLAKYLGESRLGYEDSEAEEYATRRFGITHEDAVRLGLGFDPGGNGMQFTWRSTAFSRVPRLVVPFKGFDGVARGMQGRALDVDDVRWCGPMNAEDAGWSKFAWFPGHDQNTVVITEGPGDALTVVGAGLSAVAIRGAALGHVGKELAESLAGLTVVMAGDNDEAGQLFNGVLRDALEPAGIKPLSIRIPGFSDLSEWREAEPDTFALDLPQHFFDAATPPPAAPPAPPAPQPDPVRFNLTELGNAMRLAHSFGGDLRYTPEAGFMLFNGVTWEQDRFNSVRTAAQDMLLRVEREARLEAAEARTAGDTAAEEAANKVVKGMMAAQTSRGIDAILKELKALGGVACSIEDFDAHAHLLAFRNTVVNLRTGEQLEADRGLLITRQLAVDYDPQAACPQWLQFLVDVFPNHPDLPEYMQRLVGYGVTGSTDEQCFVVLHGSGANGKSVFTETLSEVFKAITNTTPFSTFEEKASGGIPNDLAALKGARVVMASEGEAGKPMAESLLKRVTGRDQLTARFMRQEFFTFRPTFLLMLASNHKPAFRGQDEGLWRRVKLISWQRYFAPEERDHQIWQKLLDEAEGIAAWAVRGAMEWYANGLGDPPSVVKATANYRATADALAGFFPGVLDLDEGSEVLGADAFNAYVGWTEEEHLPLKERWTRRAFYSAMEERGVQRVKRERGQVLVGVRIVSKAESLSPLRAV